MASGTEVGEVCGDGRPEFFKLLQSNFIDKLPIPRSFGTYFQENEHHKATLYSPFLVKFWHVKLQQDGCNKYFGNGWESFVHAHDLGKGDLLQFRYEGNMLFTVMIFSPTGSIGEYVPYKQKEQRQTSFTNQLIPRDVAGRTINKPESGCGKKRKLEVSNVLSMKKEVASSIKTKGLPPLERTIRHYHTYKDYMYMPRTFCTSTGLDKGDEIVMKDSNGSQWPVKVCQEKNSFHLGRGWKHFVKDNDLQPGDKCILQPLSKQTLHIQIVKNEM